MAATFPEWSCSGCGAGSTALPLAHPLFTQAPVCEDCLRIYHLGEFTTEEGHEIYCRWCGNGGALFLCDGCPRATCRDCVGRNLGRGRVDRVDAGDTYFCVGRPRPRQTARRPGRRTPATMVGTTTRRAPSATCSR